MKNKDFLKICYVLVMSVFITMAIIFVSNSLIDSYILNNQQQSVQIVDKIKDYDEYHQEMQCIAQALWYEARGEGHYGLAAVASVIVNRVKSAEYPSSYCKVIHQPWQFSFVQERKQAGKPLKISYKPSEEWVYTYVMHLSKLIVEGRFQPILPAEVKWYAKNNIRNYWTKKKQKIATIGQHTFYAMK